MGLDPSPPPLTGVCSMFLFTCLMWLSRSWDMSVCVPWLRNMCDVTQSYVWHEYMCDMTQKYVWHGCMCDMTQSYVWHDSFICGRLRDSPCVVSNRIGFCMSIYVTQLICVYLVAHSYVWHDPVIPVTSWLIHVKLSRIYMREPGWFIQGA